MTKKFFVPLARSQPHWWGRFPKGSGWLVARSKRCGSQNGSSDAMRGARRWNSWTTTNSNLADTENESGYLLFRWRWAVARSDLPAPSKLVLHTLGFCMDMDGMNCQVGHARLHGLTSLCVSTVKSHLSSLEAQGWVRVERSISASGDPDANRYHPEIPTGSRVGQEMAGVGQELTGG